LVSLLLAGLVALAACGSESGSTADTESSIAEFITGEDLGSGLGTPDSADCESVDESTLECDVSFGAKTLPFVATIREDGQTVDLALAPRQKAICDAVHRDVIRLQRLGQPPNAAGQRLSEYVEGGGADPAEVRRLLTQSADSFQAYTDALQAYQPRSQWGREAKPVLVETGEQGGKALRDLAAGRGDPQAAGRALTRASETFDAQLARIPCPTVD
jgi:hypothetical protein